MYAFLQDIHIGAKFTNESLFNSLNTFFELIKDHKESCDCIFVCGDLFEHKLSVEESKTAALFMANLAYNGCGRNGVENVPVHFIHGTYSHDREQYEMFMPLLEKIPNVNVFYTNTVCSGTLSNGATVLYLPQIYDDKIDYDELFSHEYDIIVGHGEISSLFKNPCHSTDKNTTLPAEKLGEISKICVFGHYHGFTDFGNNVYYGGPWLRWKYGEDEPRVFTFCTSDYKIQTIPNKFAIEYKTVNVENIEELRGYISQNITTPHRFNITVSDDNIEEFHAIMNINKNNSNISYVVSSDKKKEENDSIDSDNVEYKTSSIEEPIPILITYIQDKYGIDTKKELEEYESRINKDS